MEPASVCYDFHDTIQNLDRTYTPSAGSLTPRRRLIIVGDVHGHLAQLKKLLETTGFDRDAGDHLIFTGDLINKGPDSPGVVQLAMDLGASAVRGNNEDRVLAAHRLISIGRVSGVSGVEGRPPFEDDSTHLPRDIPYAVSSDFLAATQLSDAQVAWLSSLPLIIRAGPLKGAASPPWNAGSVVVVHGGLVPSLPLEKQDPWAVMNMRSIVYPADDAHTGVIGEALAKRVRDRWCRRAAFQVTGDEDVDTLSRRLPDLRDGGETPKSNSSQGHHQGAIPVEAGVGKLWRDAWNETQNSIKIPEQRTVVVYGHDAMAGLQDQLEIDVPKGLEDEGAQGSWTRYAFGLDSGCAYGNPLSAMVIEPSPETGDVVHRVVQVK
ncbi:Bis(5'-nucleosyl)-tetraphosphatase, symmetrical [Colletotrichum higginsianum]|uniref:Bis(5'-nucleosyl)-tetraphosphatase, symmetrical n=1 Tax=Colletotrichum higginsianum TaxID=80884 RepID=A0A4V4NAB4_9PEZI|nr:Bis(5'-nucleosyl)-tetraphosphatase, symmetrical [Colletotrichum higginsianum]